MLAKRISAAEHTVALRSDPAAPTPAHIFRPGRNAWRVAKADRATVLIDAANYFGTLRKAMLEACHSITIIGWDVDSRTPLVGPSGEPEDGLPRELGPFLIALVERRPELKVNILLWDYSLFFTSERQAMPAYVLQWRTPPQIDLCLDDAIPLGSSHHQKIVVLDEALAFSGGLDLTIRRWDHCDHDPANPHRVDPAGKPYRGFHDVQMMVDGAAARAMTELARARWARAAVEDLPEVPRAEAPWPADVKAHFHNVDVAISRTEPPYAAHAIVQEVETLFHDMIASARRTLYVESQYLTCSRFARVLAKAMKRNPELEAIVVGPFAYRGRLERAVMTSGRARVARILRKARVADRVLLAAPRIDHNGEVADPHVHAKVMIVDDRYLRVGSANLCHRSMGTDSECDLTVAAGDDPAAQAGVRDLRNVLIAEHCGATLDEVEAAIEKHGSVIAAVKSLPKRSHWLEAVSDHSLPLSPPGMLEVVADPRAPIDPTRMLAGNAVGRRHRRPLLAAAGIVLALLVFLGMAAAWRLTPLAELADPNAWTGIMANLHGPWALLAVVLLFALMGLVMFPVLILIAVTAAVFGTWPGLLYAGAGAMASALVTYALGRWLGPRGLRQFFGPRLNLITRSFARRGIPTVTLVRLVPVAPFSLVNLAAGAICIPALDYLLGTAIGLAPGLVVMSLLGDQAILLIRTPSLHGAAILVGLLAAAIAVSVGLQIFVSRRRDQAARPGRRLRPGTVP